MMPQSHQVALCKPRQRLLLLVHQSARHCQRSPAHSYATHMRQTARPQCHGMRMSVLFCCCCAGWLRYPPGHGDVYAALVNSGVLDELVSEVRQADGSGSLRDSHFYSCSSVSVAPFMHGLKQFVPVRPMTLPRLSRTPGRSLS